MLLEGKKGLVVGIANKRSLAWGIAQSVSREGARLAVTYQGERLEKNVRKLAAELNEPVILPCDVTRDEEMDSLATTIGNEWGGLDFVIHAVAFALRDELNGEYLDTSREGYRVAQDVSAYSLVALARRMAPLMEGRGGEHRNPDLFGRAARCPPLQRHGCGEGGARGVGSLSGCRLGASRCSCERYFRGPGQDDRRLGSAQYFQDARVPSELRSVAEEHRAGRSGGRGRLLGVGAIARRHRRRAVRG